MARASIFLPCVAWKNTDARSAIGFRSRKSSLQHAALMPSPRQVLYWAPGGPPRPDKDPGTGGSLRAPAPGLSQRRCTGLAKEELRIGADQQGTRAKRVPPVHGGCRRRSEQRRPPPRALGLPPPRRPGDPAAPSARDAASDVAPLRQLLTGLYEVPHVHRNL